MSDDQPTPTFSSSSDERPSRPWYKKKRFIIPLALALLFIAIGIAGGGGEEDPGKVVSPTTAAPSNSVQPPAKASKAEFTLAKYEQLQDGMTYEQVKAIAGGEPSSHSNSDVGGMKYDNYSWAGDGLGDTVMTGFQDGKLISKSQYGLGAG